MHMEWNARGDATYILPIIIISHVLNLSKHLTIITIEREVWKVELLYDLCVWGNLFHRRNWLDIRKISHHHHWPINKWIPQFINTMCVCIIISHVITHSPYIFFLLRFVLLSCANNSHLFAKTLFSKAWLVKEHTHTQREITLIVSCYLLHNLKNLISL